MQYSRKEYSVHVVSLCSHNLTSTCGCEKKKKGCAVTQCSRQECRIRKLGTGNDLVMFVTCVKLFEARILGYMSTNCTGNSTS